MQVARRRRINETAQVRLFGRHFRRRSLFVATGVALALAFAGTAVAQTHQFDAQQVGQVTAGGIIIEGRHQTILN
jgi:hypothetical protein